MKVIDIMRRDPVTMTERDDLALALQVMLWRGIRHIPIVRAGDVLVGILSERALLSLTREGLSSQTVGDVMVSQVKHIDPNADVADAASTMSVERIGCLPVVADGVLQGLITRTDLLALQAQSVLPEPEPLGKRVGDVMTVKVATVRAGDRLLDAVASMLQTGARHLPVIDGDGRVVGIVSDRDVRTAIGDPAPQLVARRAPARVTELRVRDVMTSDPRTVTEDDPLSSAVQALVRERFGALPVIDEEERLVGMLSYIDALRTLVETK